MSIPDILIVQLEEGFLHIMRKFLLNHCRTPQFNIQASEKHNQQA